jgi:uncharacterized protein with LGFP repeats
MRGAPRALSLGSMEINRRRMLRRIAQAATVATSGSLAAAAPLRRPASAPAHPPLVPPHVAAVGRWAAPRPAIVPRTLWQTDNKLPQPPAQYDRVVRAVFVHHTDGGNHYGSRQVPDLIRAIYSDHRESRDWDDIGYNFLVDRDGTIYEGRHGGIDRAVVGAHTIGFNRETVGIAAIGTYVTGAAVPQPVLDSIAAIAAWKLGMCGVDPRGTADLVSTNSESRFRAGTHHTFNAISGHRDAYCTQCPGDALFALLPWVRAEAAHLQGRAGRPLGHAAAPAGRGLRPAFWPGRGRSIG